MRRVGQNKGKAFGSHPEPSHLVDFATQGLSCLGFRAAICRAARNTDSGAGKGHERGRNRHLRRDQRGDLSRAHREVCMGAAPGCRSAGGPLDGPAWRSTTCDGLFSSLTTTNRREDPSAEVAVLAARAFSGPTACTIPAPSGFVFKTAKTETSSADVPLPSMSVIRLTKERMEGVCCLLALPRSGIRNDPGRRISAGNSARVSKLVRVNWRTRPSPGQLPGRLVSSALSPPYRQDLCFGSFPQEGLS